MNHKYNRPADVDAITYFGSSYNDYAGNIQIYNENIYIGGRTQQPFNKINDLPITIETAFKTELLGYEGSFFAVLDLTGENLLYSSYLGNDGAHYSPMKVHSNGDVYTAGGHNTYFFNFSPLKKAITIQDLSGYYHGFIAAFSPNTTPGGDLIFDLKFSTLFGGNESTAIVDIDIDEYENIYITGYTTCDANSFKPTQYAYDVENTSLKNTIYMAKIHLDEAQGHLVIDYNTFFGQPNYSVYGYNQVFPQKLLFRDQKFIISGFVHLDYELPMINSFSDKMWVNGAGSTAFLIALEPDRYGDNDGSNDLVYSSYFGYNKNSYFLGMDYDETCDKVILCGNTHSELWGFGYQIEEPYNGNYSPNYLYCVVDVNLSGVNSLRELAYSHPFLLRLTYSMNCIKIEQGTNEIYSAGAMIDDYSYSKDVVEFFGEFLEKEDCSICPCPDYFSDGTHPWFELSLTENSQNCNPGQCYLTNSLNIPQDVTCYAYYQVDDGTGFTQLEQIPISGSLDYINRCVDDGTEITMTIRLLKTSNDPNPCEISQTVICGCVCPQDRNDWLTLTATEGGGDCDFPQCNIRSELKIPSEYNCYSNFYVDDSSTMSIIYDTPDYGGNIDYIDRCLAAGEELVITLYLLEDINDQNPCVITKTISCPCDCPDDVGNWLNIEVVPGDGQECAAYECKTSYSWDIPQGYECFSHYSDDGEVILPMTTNPEIDIPDCIQSGFDYPFSVALMRGPDDPEPCYIDKDIYCEIDEDALPCYPGECNENWEKGKELPPIYLDACPGCKIKITYWTRIACPVKWGGYQEIQITKIEKYNEEGVPVANCEGCTDEDVYIQAVESVIAFNLMNFKPRKKEDPCSYSYRISKASCWAEWKKYIYDDEEELIRIVTVYKPCNSDCCYRMIKVCREGKYNIKMTDLGVRTDYNDCQSVEYIPPAPADPISCIYTCDMLENYDEEYQGKIPEVDINNQDDFNYEDNKQIEINVSNNSDIFKVMVDTKSFNHLSISIYNMKGKLLTQISESLTHGINIYNVNINDFASGAYLYSIEADGIIIESDKFIIDK